MQDARQIDAATYAAAQSIDRFPVAESHISSPPPGGFLGRNRICLANMIWATANLRMRRCETEIARDGAQFCGCTKFLSLRKHSHETEHAVVKMRKDTANHEIGTWLRKMHDFSAFLQRKRRESRIQPSVNPAVRVIDQ
jgi:hypothetical protein